MKHELVILADEFANEAHTSVGQVRKYTGEPYIVHPREVREILLKFSTVEVTPEQEAAALLHDVVEDTKVTIDEVRDRFGDEVATLVSWLTDVSKPSDGNRRVRKTIDKEHTAAAPTRAKNIKLADLISNTTSIVANDPAFAEVYLKEKVALLNVMDDADIGLFVEAHRVLNESILKLENDRLQEALKPKD